MRKYTEDGGNPTNKIQIEKSQQRLFFYFRNFEEI